MTAAPAYRPEVDGLRAAAVLPVILFHIGFEIDGVRLFSGGYVGVDVFFVISGYLITGILLSDLRQDRFSIGRFLERRVRRILPALTLVTAVSIPLAWLMMTPDQMINFGQSVVAVTTFTANILFWLESGYFDTTTELKPLLHTWSLAVEEQFYAIFPWVLLAGWLWCRRHLLAVFGLLAAASLAAAIHWSDSANDATFYLLPTRGWELLAGALVAVWEQNRDARPTAGPVPGVATALGVVLIAAALFLFDENSVHPGYITVLPVAGTLLILIFGGGRDPGSRMLSTPAIVGIGLISYSLYLWHQPLIAFYRHYALAEPSLLAKAGIIALASLMAILSWRFVERPCRQRDLISLKRLLAGLFVLSAAVTAFGAAAHLTAGFPERLSAEERAVAETYWERETVVQDGRPCHNRPVAAACRFGAAAPASEWIVVGDSHGPTVLSALLDRLDLVQTAVTDFTQSGCPYIRGFTVEDDGGACLRENDAIAEVLAASPSSTVVFVARLPMHLTGTGFDNGEGGVERLDALLVPADGALTMDAALDRTMAELLDWGHRILLLYPVPEAGWHVPGTSFKNRRFGPYASLEPLLRDGLLTTDSGIVSKRLAPSNAFLDGIPADPRIARVRPQHILCGTRFPGRCMLEDETDAFYLDTNHLSRHGAIAIADRLIEVAALPRN